MMFQGIDLSRFRVVYDEKVLNALEIGDMLFKDDKYPAIDKQLIVKPQFLTVTALNEDGNVIIITDEAWRFQFLPIVKGV